MTSFWSAIMNGAILSAAFSIGVGLALRVIPRYLLNAATRHAIWWLVLIATLAMPLFYSEWRFAKPSASAATYQSGRTLNDDLQWNASPVEKAASAVSFPIRIPAGPLLRPALIAWIACAFLLLMRVVISYVALYRRTSRATDAPPELDGRIEHWLAQSGASRRHVRLVLSEEISIPMATGPFRPAVILPAALFGQMSNENLEQIGLHEAAHLARRDDYTLFVQRIIEALFFLHPVVRWLTRQIDLEREIACDDMVARSHQQARSYAECLTSTIALCGGVRISLAATSVADSRSHLSRRVELLLSARRNVAPGFLGRRFAMIAVGLMCAIGLLARTPRFIAFAGPAMPSPAPASIAVTPIPASTPVEPILTTLPRPMVIAQAIVTPAHPDQPETVEEQLAQGNQQMKDQQYAEAIATFLRALSQAKDDEEKGKLWSHIGEAYRYQGDLPKSIQAMEHALEFIPNNAAALTNLALLFEVQGDKLQARRYYEKTIAIDPNNPLATNNLAYLLTETGGDLDLALTYARTAQQKLPNFPEITDTIGWIYLKKNMPDDAIGQFKTLTEAAPNNPVYHYHYAMALDLKGNQAEAVKECLVALNIHPGGPLEEQIRELMNKLAPEMDPISKRPSLK